jgi:hypothetical protein
VSECWYSFYWWGRNAITNTNCVIFVSPMRIYSPRRQMVVLWKGSWMMHWTCKVIQSDTDNMKQALNTNLDPLLVRLNWLQGASCDFFKYLEISNFNALGVYQDVRTKYLEWLFLLAFFEENFKKSLLRGRVTSFRTRSFNDEQNTSMAYLGF